MLFREACSSVSFYPFSCWTLSSLHWLLFRRFRWLVEIDIDNFCRLDLAWGVIDIIGLPFFSSELPGDNTRFRSMRSWKFFNKTLVCSLLLWNGFNQSKYFIVALPFFLEVFFGNEIEILKDGSAFSWVFWKSW